MNEEDLSTIAIIFFVAGFVVAGLGVYNFFDIESMKKFVEGDAYNYIVNGIRILAFFLFSIILLFIGFIFKSYSDNY